MKNKTIFLLFVSQIASLSLAGKVVFLRGTGCAGKSSLCSQIIEQNSSWHYVGEDEIFYQEAVLNWQQEFPDGFEAIEKAIEPENRLHAILRKQILFKTTATDEERADAKAAIAAIQQELNSRDKKKEKKNGTSWAGALRNKITQEIIDRAHEKTVIVDTWFLKPEHIKQVSDNHDVVHLIAYSGFPEIVKRTMKRNYAALVNGKDISNLRFFHQALKSFTGLYDLSSDAQGSIAMLEKEAVTHALDLVELQLQNSPDATGSSKAFTRGEFSVQEFQEYRKELLDTFKSSPVAYVVPKSPFDLVVRTDDADPAACAQTVIGFVELYDPNK